jgi:cytoskeleton protein RodZ
MSEPTPSTAQTESDRPTAGLLLRQARQSRGLHIAALATSIKVTPRKLELLEADRYDELPDLAFARALAQTVCRSLKTDPAPVLALLPKLPGGQLNPVMSRINEPLLERSGQPGRDEPSPWRQALRPQWLLPGLLVLAAVAVYFLPGQWGFRSPSSSPTQSAPEPLPAVVEVPAAPEVTPPLLPETVELLPPVEGASAAVSIAVPAQPAPPLLELRASQSAWVEVQDASNKPLIARLVQAGEVVNLEGEMPLRLKVGNAANTTVRFRGQPIDLAPSTRDNVARIELK